MIENEEIYMFKRRLCNLRVQPRLDSRCLFEFLGKPVGWLSQVHE